MSQREELLAVLRKLGMKPEQNADESEVYIHVGRIVGFHSDDDTFYAVFSFDQEDDFTGASIEPG